MRVRLVGEECKYALAVYFDKCGFDMETFDIMTNTIVTKVLRLGRTDEDIDRCIRQARVATTVLLTLYVGLPVSPGIRYRIVE